MTRQQRKIIEREFYRYKENMKKAATAAADCAYRNFSVDYTSPRVKSSPIGNTAENKIVKLIEEEDHAWRWCVVFQKTMEHFLSEQKDELMRRRYIEREHFLKTCNELCLSSSTYFYWVEDVLQIAFRWAKELKII